MTPTATICPRSHRAASRCVPDRSGPPLGGGGEPGGGEGGLFGVVVVADDNDYLDGAESRGPGADLAE
jgi:hypothetical protein